MTKESAAWLAIRIIGLLVLAKSFVLLFDVAAHALSFQQLQAIAENQSFGNDLTSKADQMALRAQFDVGLGLAQALIAGGLAFYLLRRGKAVHSMLMAETK